MDNTILIFFGIPKHGWLPIDFHYKDFHLDFDASDVLNDPVEELYNAVTKLTDNERRRVAWWLEPAAYFFDFERSGQNIILSIIETEDLHNESSDKTLLIKIIGDDREIIEPFRIALRNFSLHTYEENRWQYKLDKDKIESL